MQEAAVETIGNGCNVLLLSPTGSGKTLAFLLPLIDCLAATDDREDEGVRAVIIVPSRELAQQIDSVARDLIREWQLPLRCMAIYGGRAAMDEHRVIKEVHPDIIVATPGRFLDHVDKDNIDVSRACTLIIDEYDKCLELGFKDEMDCVITTLSHCSQVVLTSATKSEQAVTAFGSRKLHTLDYLDNQELEVRLHTYIVASPEKDKLDTLALLLTQIADEQSIVFVAHRESAERIVRFLTTAKFVAVMYHGGMEQDHRERALYKFRAGAATVLVSTDLAARGLDIPTVRHVIHYHLPADEAVFTHRSGRTARWEDSGSAYLIVGPEESVPAYVSTTTQPFPITAKRICSLQPRWTLLYIGRGKKAKLSRADILGFLCKKGGLNAQQIGRIDVAPLASYVAVERTAVKSLMQNIAGEKIKGLRTIIEPIRH